MSKKKNVIVELSGGKTLKLEEYQTEINFPNGEKITVWSSKKGPYFADVNRRQLRAYADDGEIKEERQEGNISKFKKKFGDMF